MKKGEREKTGEKYCSKIQAVICIILQKVALNLLKIPNRLCYNENEEEKCCERGFSSSCNVYIVLLRERGGL